MDRSRSAAGLARVHAAAIALLDYFLIRCFVLSKILTLLSAIPLALCLVWFAIWPRIIWRQDPYRVPALALGLPIMAAILLCSLAFFLFATEKLSH